MAKEWGSRNERELWRDHNLEDGTQFIWPDGVKGEVLVRMQPRIYKVAYGELRVTRVVTEAFIAGCLEHHGEPMPETNLWYSAWPNVKDVRKSQNRVVFSIVCVFAFVVIACVVLALVVAPSLH